MPPLPTIQLWIEPTLPSDWPADGLGSLEVMTSQMPAADSLPAGTWVGVRPSRGGGSRGLFARLLGARPAGAHLALRCTALLARGYEQVGAGVDERGQPVAWGRVPAA